MAKAIPSTLALLLLLLSHLLLQLTEACTAIVIGRLATTDGSTYAASSADCSECDFRLAKVPARTHGVNATRPVYLYNYHYPHVVSGRARTWEASNLEGTASQLALWSSGTKPLGYIPEVKHTYALFEGGAGYGIMNEHGVAMGESTCPSRFVAKPKGYGGDALLDVGELTKLGLERGKTAREAIAVMGEMAEQYGYYGAEWDTKDKYDEGGEAIVVADGKDAWVFHVTADDSGTSAVWVAQRVADTDVAVVANAFVVREVDLGDEKGEWFMWSKNIRDVGKRSGVWDGTGGKVDFARVFGGLKEPSQNSYYTLRMWRVFGLVDEGMKKKLSPHPNDWMDGYPFSVRAKKKLSREDVFGIFRDHFEGTRFDLTKGEAGGPYGNPDRYDVGNESGVAGMGEFGRGISMFRTSYTGVGQSGGGRKGLLWFAPQQASSSVFVPLDVGIEEVPRGLTRGSLFRYSNESMYWMVTMVGNWVHRWYEWSATELNGVRQGIEGGKGLDGVGELVERLVRFGQGGTATRVLERFATGKVEEAMSGYVELFEKLVGKYHDGYVREGEGEMRVRMRPMGYPRWWLEKVGYFSAKETGGSWGMEYPKEEGRYMASSGDLKVNTSWKEKGIWFVVGMTTWALLDFSIQWWRRRKSGNLAVGTICSESLAEHAYERIS
eukprot:GFKZ01007207.1.p1 GENE.GFKZ01007207.1~~GFKZ01007207.1.p1  ORF type:complete len:665 (+),score=106.55 GFKZ01007207.1:449-2443(+)